MCIYIYIYLYVCTYISYLSFSLSLYMYIYIPWSRVSRRRWWWCRRYVYIHIYMYVYISISISIYTYIYIYLSIYTLISRVSASMVMMSPSLTRPMGPPTWKAKRKESGSVRQYGVHPLPLHTEMDRYPPVHTQIYRCRRPWPGRWARQPQKRKQKNLGQFVSTGFTLYHYIQRWIDTPLYTQIYRCRRPWPGRWVLRPKCKKMSRISVSTGLSLYECITTLQTWIDRYPLYKHRRTDSRPWPGRWARQPETKKKHMRSAFVVWVVWSEICTKKVKNIGQYGVEPLRVSLNYIQR